MAKHNQTGETGEAWAASYLVKQGFSILVRNYRYKKAEIDLIAQKGKQLVFVEVKTRTANNFGYPEESVTAKKEQLFLLAADEYIHQSQWQHDIRFDIIAVTIGTAGDYQIHHIEDACH